ncbi:MAG: radical SAM protein [Elusimicrobiota bacterium]
MRNSFSFYIKNFGCKVNQYDGNILSNAISSFWKQANNLASADLIAVNTCGVTKTALKSGFAYIRKIKKNFPDKEIVVTGCAAGRNKNEFQKEGVEVIPHFIYLNRPGAELRKFDGHKRGFLKIQQGCYGKCSYCVVKDMKKPFYVKNPEQVISEIMQMTKNHPEIVLCGTNLEYYAINSGLKKSRNLLNELIIKISKIKPFFRWRFSSIPPGCLTDKNLAILRKDKKFCPHFHIPVQSGSEKILKKMRRPYSIHFLKSRLNKVLEVFDKPGFSYDIMVGYPSETEDDFMKTIKFLEKYPPVRVHIFRYSNVKDIEFENEVLVDEKIKKRRLQRVKKTAAYLSTRIKNKAVGHIKEVVPENGFNGYTREYLPVKLTTKVSGSKPIKARVTHTEGGKLIANPIDCKGCYSKNTPGVKLTS